MKVEELRIGSILSYKDKRFKILEISQSKLKAQSNKGLVLFEVTELEPIELTEEILLSIKGINKKIVDNKGLELTIYTINDIELLFTFGILRNIKFMNNKVIIYTAFRDFKLHDLQNLYFILNGKELEINL